jgi:cysteinyl-tRNA synthetase
LRDSFSAGQYQKLAADLKFLGIWDGESPSQISQLYVHDASINRQVADRIGALLAQLDQARSAKDYVLADAIRAKLTEAGVIVKTANTGTSYEISGSFDPAKLDAFK